MDMPIKPGSLTNTLPAAAQVKPSSEKEPPAVEAAAVEPYAVLTQKDKYQLTPSEEAVVKAVEKANKLIMGPPKKFEFNVHKPSGEISVKVVNAETNEVIREIPPEKLLDIIDGLSQLSGMIIDEKR